MITELIPVINTIITFGLEPNLTVKKTDRDKVLEKSLVKIYSYILTLSMNMTIRISEKIKNTDMPK